MKATEKARTCADTLGVDLAAVTGTGKDGKITVADVRRAAAEGERSQTGPDLGERGNRIRGDVEAYLREHRLTEDVHREQIELYVMAVLRAIDKRREADHEPTVLGSKGQVVLNPVCKIANEATLEAHRWAESLLLTPSALKRHLQAAEGDDDDDDLGF